MRTLWAIVVAICLIATGASRVRPHDEHRDREAKHTALRVVAATALIAAPGRAHGGPDGAPLVTARHEPPARHHVPVAPAGVVADRDPPGLVDATSHRSRAPPTTDSTLS